MSCCSTEYAELQKDYLCNKNQRNKNLKWTQSSDMDEFSLQCIIKIKKANVYIYIHTYIYLKKKKKVSQKDITLLAYPSVAASNPGVPLKKLLFFFFPIHKLFPAAIRLNHAQGEQGDDSRQPAQVHQGQLLPD